MAISNSLFLKKLYLDEDSKNVNISKPEWNMI